MAAAQLAAQPLCVMCTKEGRIEPARICDHVVPHRGSAELFWDTGNLQSLCRHHHDADKQRTEGRGSFETYQ